MDRRGPERLARPLAACWLLLSLLPVHNVIQRANEDAVSGLGLEPLLELGYFGGVGLFALATIRELEPDLGRSRPPVHLFLLPVWIVGSSVWSQTGPYALARGLQLVVVALLAWATLALGRASRAGLDDLVQTYLRWFVRIAAALVVIGIVFGAVRVPASAANLRRFTWIGAHPNGSGLVLAVALIIMLATPHRVLRLHPLVRVATTGGLLAALLFNQSRASGLSLAGGLVLVYVLLARRRPALRLWTPLLVVGGVGFLALGGRGLLEAFSRGQRTTSLVGGNGRLSLWSIGFDALLTPFDWIFGLGYGAARTVFVAERAWATTAHNSVLALLVSVGIIGVILLFVVLGITAHEVATSSLGSDPRYGLGLVGVLGVVCVNGLASDVLAEPNIGFVVLYLVAAAATGRLPRPPVHRDPAVLERTPGQRTYPASGTAVVRR